MSLVIDYASAHGPGSRLWLQMTLRAFLKFCHSRGWVPSIRRPRLASIPEGVSRGAHGFRHAFASRLCGKIPLKHLSDMLGHRDLSSVMVYAKVNFDDLAQAALPWPEEDAQ